MRSDHVSSTVHATVPSVFISLSCTYCESGVSVGTTPMNSYLHLLSGEKKVEVKYAPDVRTGVALRAVPVTAEVTTIGAGDDPLGDAHADNIHNRIMVDNRITYLRITTLFMWKQFPVAVRPPNCV